MSTALADRKTEIRPAREREPEAGALAAVRPPLYAKGTVPHLVALGRVTGAITRQLAISAEFRSDEGGLSLHAGADLPGRGTPTPSNRPLCALMRPCTASSGTGTTGAVWNDGTAPAVGARKNQTTMT